MSACRAAAAAALAVGVALAGCSVPPNPAYDPSLPHHRPTGFQNNDIDFKPKNFFTDVLLGWQLPSWFKGLPPPPEAPPPVVAPDVAWLRANTSSPTAQPSATFIGHATVLVQLPTVPRGALNLLTDPHFSERASPLSFAGPKRVQPPGVALADLPLIDIVVISHNHYDHLDDASVRALAAQPGGSPLFLVPLGLKAWLAERGIGNALELDWWDAVTLPAGAESAAAPPRAADLTVQHAVGPDTVAPAGRVQLVLTPVQHWSGRSLNDRLHTLWGGWAALSPGLRVFFAGDTGYSRDFATVRTRLASPRGDGFDLALIPIGAYEPRWFMREQHVNPAESVRIHRDLGARRSLGIHWGSFALTDEAIDQPPKDLAAARREQGLPDDAFFTLAIGATRRLAAPP